MSLFLDHVFLLTTKGAPIGDQLVEAGFNEGSSNTHPGQGSANRRFFFNDFVLELLFINDREEAIHGAGRDLRLYDRSQQANNCPFGLVFRVTDSSRIPDFPSWQYYPDYFHGKLCFYVANNSNRLTEPLMICMPPSLPKASYPPDAENNKHLALSEVVINLPSAPDPTGFSFFESVEKLRFAVGDDYHMAISFNKGQSAKTLTLDAPHPLSLHW